MSSIIVSYSKTNCLIASDSRYTKIPEKKCYDYYPKLFHMGEAIIGIAGVSGYYDKKLKKDMEIGEFLLKEFRGDYLSALLSFTSTVKRNLSDDFCTQFVIVEQGKEYVHLREITVTSNNIALLDHDGSTKTIIYGVRHCAATLDYDFSSYFNDLSVIKKLIKIDEDADKIANTPGTVGGPIQAYLVTPDRIKDLSDNNAPKDFSKYYKWANANE